MRVADYESCVNVMRLTQLSRQQQRIISHTADGWRQIRDNLNDFHLVLVENILLAAPSCLYESKSKLGLNIHKSLDSQLHRRVK
jgi:hypothetical protein